MSRSIRTPVASGIGSPHHAQLARAMGKRLCGAPVPDDRRQRPPWVHACSLLPAIAGGGTLCHRRALPSSEAKGPLALPVRCYERNDVCAPPLVIGTPGV